MQGRIVVSRLVDDLDIVDHVDAVDGARLVTATSRQLVPSGRPRLVLPFARRFSVPGFDVPVLVRATREIFEYPMADRDPLPRWSFGHVTLLGDAAHPMYLVGSNGASQAILDARCLADSLARSEHPRAALWRYEQERLAATSEVVALNRKGGPEQVIDEVEKRAPAGFDDINDVLSEVERRALVVGYAKTAGFHKPEPNNHPPQ